MEMYRSFICSILLALLLACTSKTNDMKGIYIESDEPKQGTKDIYNSLDSTRFDTQTEVKIIYHKVSESEYNERKKENRTSDTLVKITNIELAKSLLKGIVFWTDSTSEIPSSVWKIILSNGDSLEILDRNRNIDSHEFLYFSAYFPSQNILLFEGWHATDISFNLLNGETTEITGNPEMSYISPNSDYKIMGYYSGQVSKYFLQKKSQGGYQTVIDFHDYFIKNCQIEFIVDGFWVGNNRFYLTAKSMLDYDVNLYYRLTITP